MIPLIALLGLLVSPGDGPSMPPVPSKKPPVAVVTPGPGPMVDPPVGTQPVALELYFTYGSEKKEWIEAATKKFNDSAPKLADGRKIVVKARAFGSGEIVDGLLKGTEEHKAHLISPAASAFLVLGNAESKEKEQGDLVGPTTDLVRSPVVIALWREQAEALGWPSKPISWADLSLYARDPAAWAKVAGEAGKAPFTIAHTHPERSSSGLHALFALAYVQSGKFADGLTRTDVAGSAEFAKFLGEFEKAVPFYESSTGFLAERMLGGSAADLTAAIVYENLVVAANRATAAEGKPPRIVAIYPAEGTFPTEHPAAVVNRPWVTPAHKEAAALYLAFLRSPEQQNEARKLGFRAADRSADGDAAMTAALGATAAEPKELKIPPASVIRALRTAWETAKNPGASPAKGK